MRATSPASILLSVPILVSIMSARSKNSVSVAPGIRHVTVTETTNNAPQRPGRTMPLEKGPDAMAVVKGGGRVRPGRGAPGTYRTIPTTHWVTADCRRGQPNAHPVPRSHSGRSASRMRITRPAADLFRNTARCSMPSSNISRPFRPSIRSRKKSCGLPALRTANTSAHDRSFFQLENTYKGRISF